MRTLSLENVRKSYGHLEVIHGVSLDVEDAEFVALVDLVDLVDPIVAHEGWLPTYQ